MDLLSCQKFIHDRIIPDTFSPISERKNGLQGPCPLGENDGPKVSPTSSDLAAWLMLEAMGTDLRGVLFGDRVGLGIFSIFSMTPIGVQWVR